MGETASRRKGERTRECHNGILRTRPLDAPFCIDAMPPKLPYHVLVQQPIGRGKGQVSYFANQLTCQYKSNKGLAHEQTHYHLSR
jgi:hypothetical protein